MTPRSISLVIVDDHPLVRESLALLLAMEPAELARPRSPGAARQPAIKVVATCADADAGAAVVRRARPDVVLMDIEMPGTNAFQVVRELRSEGVTTRFVFLSAFLTDHYLQEALDLGDCGYLMKSADLSEIACAVRQVAAGTPYFSPEAASRLDASPERSTLTRLTARELQVLRLVASDLSCKEIAKKLGLSARTVDRHKANIMEKLGIHTQVGLTRFALAEGMCSPRAPT